MLECTADMDSLMSSPKALRGEKGTDYWHINTLSYPQRETEVMLLCMWILVKKKRPLNLFKRLCLHHRYFVWF